eukprot:TRINITY_DN6443_c0_g1_i1.p2 TRINITY_DN6443_c0_g1~~TRINITY_DN6443_c0_g1_i1.p2  ORF type:complete len:286 (-),score=81.36 TRINITY_DN6443_c0_g1_i1:1162-2019(-)
MAAEPKTSQATSKFLSGLKAVAAFTAKKTGEAITHLKSPPSKITCVGCDVSINVPEEFFNWKCGACNTPNHWSNKECRACKSVKAASASSGSSEPLTMLCTRCGVVNDVPLHNAKKHVKTVVKVTKELAAKTSAYAKEQYAANKAVPDTFHCEHCNEVLPNPNAAPPAYSAADARPEEDKEASPEAPQIARIDCTQCGRSTDIPATVGADKARVGKFHASRGSSKVYFGAREHPHVDCPKCKSSIKLTQDAKTKTLMPYVQDLGSNKYSVKCPKCTTDISAAVAL